LIPAFPGTNSEYDSAKAFREAGADAEILVFRNLSARHIEESLTTLAEKIRQSQILMFPGGFSAGDEPDGSAKFIATIIRSPRVADAIMDLLKNRDGLILGICNGFQALIKTGLVPYGEIVAGTTCSSPSGGQPVPQQIPHDPSVRPTLVHNTIGRHISRYAHTRVSSTLSPWLSNSKAGDIHTIPLSHGEGRFYASPEIIARPRRKGPDRHPILRRIRHPVHGHRPQSERLVRCHRRHHLALRPDPRQNGPHRTLRNACRQKHPRQQTPADLYSRSPVFYLIRCESHRLAGPRSRFGKLVRLRGIRLEEGAGADCCSSTALNRM
jgi:phosphoribosylformylglycinamidine (FGAM) synthase-like amidotransferase family enzyme